MTIRKNSKKRRKSEINLRKVHEKNRRNQASFIRHDPFFSVLAGQKSGLCLPQVCNVTIDWIGYSWAFKKQAGGTAKYEAAFRSLNFQKNPISKKPAFLKNDFELMHATLKAIGSRWVIFIFGKKLRNSFQGKQETLSHFSTKLAHHLLKGSNQVSCRSF